MESSASALRTPKTTRRDGSRQTRARRRGETHGKATEVRMPSEELGGEMC